MQAQSQADDHLPEVDEADWFYGCDGLRQSLFMPPLDDIARSCWQRSIASLESLACCPNQSTLPYGLPRNMA